MQPPLTRVRVLKAALLLGAWTAYGALCASQSHYWFASTRNPMSWADAFRFELTYAWLWALITPAILRFSARYRFDRQYWLRRVPLHMAGIAVTVPTIRILYELIAWPPNGAFHYFTWSKLFRNIESNLDTGALLYIVVVVLEHAVVYYERYQSGLVKASQLQTQLVQAQLQALKMQLHPHFLFNTLNTVAALVHEDPDRAEQTIARLSEMLRMFLANSAVHESPLREELRILELYLEIERTRFEERIQVRFDVPAELLDATVPNLVLQPLVENAIRHGIGKIAGNGVVSVSAEKVGEALVLTVADNGAGLAAAPHSSGAGMGLAITRGRLETLYGRNHSLVLRNLAGGGAEARIAMPLRITRVRDNSREDEYAELQSADRG